jgi:hypothetical protein
MYIILSACEKQERRAGVDNSVAKDLPSLLKWMMFDDSGRRACL